MSVNTQTVQVDLNTGKIQAVVYAHQNDSNRSIVFEVFNNGAVFSLTGSTVKFGLKSPTVKGQYTVIAGFGMASGSVSGNKVTFEIPEEYTKIAGVGLLTMIITNSSKTIRPVNIKFVIHESADGDSVVAGASDFPSTMEEIVNAWMTGNVELYVDDTLSIPDMAAEAEATGEALAMKKLMVDDDDVLYLQDSFSASDQQIVQLAEVVGAWLEAHPEATTTVANNSITTAKIKDANVTEGKIQNGSISTEKIKDQNVTADKIESEFLSTIVNPTTQATTLTYGGKTFTFYRFGNIVVCSSGTDITSADNGYNIIGTLPEEFRPASIVVSRVSNVIDLWQFSVGADGVVRLYTTYAVTAAHNCAVNAVWIAAN